MLLRRRSPGVSRLRVAAVVCATVILVGCSTPSASAPATDSVSPYLHAIAAARWDDVDSGQAVELLRESRASVFGTDGPVWILDVSMSRPRFSGVVTPNGQEYTVDASVHFRDEEGTRTAGAVLTLNADGEVVDARGAD